MKKINLKYILCAYVIHWILMFLVIGIAMLVYGASNGIDVNFLTKISLGWYIVVSLSVLLTHIIAGVWLSNKDDVSLKINLVGYFALYAVLEGIYSLINVKNSIDENPVLLNFLGPLLVAVCLYVVYRYKLNNSK